VKSNRIFTAVTFIASVILILSACELVPGSNSDTLPPIVTEPPPDIALETRAALTGVTVPARDMAELAHQFQTASVTIGATLPDIPTQPGGAGRFWIKDLLNNSNREVTATLAYQSDGLSMWLEVGRPLDVEKVAEAANFIESQILPTNYAFFGSIPATALGDGRIHILHLSQGRGMAAAYFLSGDQYVKAVNPYSNQRQLLYVNLEAAPIGNNTYYRTIAHELQHLIQWHVNRSEDAWLKEGLAELAVHLNGLALHSLQSYVQRTDIQLNTLSHDPDVISAHYAAAFLFCVYFLDRFGLEATQEMLRHPKRGLPGLSEVVARLEPGLTFDDLFADWLVANYLDGIGRGEGVYQYHSLEMLPIQPVWIRRLPASATASVNQYGADFWQFSSQEPVTVVFTGTRQVGLVDVTPYSGHYFWMSYPADESAMSLTHAFDLTALDVATLTFWTWYEIELGWDYAYVAASTDNGKTWELMETASTTYENPQGNNLGPGFTGISGGGDRPMWVQEKADLSPYSGQTILIRFYYVTDDAIHKQGIFIDDIAIPELGYLDDVESGEAGWRADGFVRVGEIVPQTHIVQIILLGAEQVRVERLLLDDKQQGRWSFPMGREFNEAVLIVAGSAPVTRYPSVYAYEIAYESVHDR
jgi:immune inhibitor A